MEYKALYRVSEVAEILQTNVNFVYKLIKEKQLPAIKLGAAKVRGRDLEMFINNYPESSYEEINKEEV
jgi:excisionase family DNA binding protein